MSVSPSSDIDPSRARVILLGAETFPLLDAANAKKKLAPLSKEAFRNSVGEFEKYLCDHHPSGFGIADPAAQILNLFDADAIGPAQINSIRKYLADADPTPTDVLVYYVGHGQPKSSVYYLCVKNTEVEALNTTAINAQELVRVLGEAIKSRYRRMRVYLFLDACFSAFPFEGQAVDEPDRHHLKGLPSQGMAALCSSGNDELSISPEGWPLTLYTRALLDALREVPGAWAGDVAAAEEEAERMSLHCLHERMWERIPRLHSTDPVKPRLFNPKQDHGLVDRVGLFPNPRYVARPDADPPRLLDDLCRWWTGDEPDAAVRQLESRIATTVSADWIAVSKWLADEKGAAGVVFLFAGLSHADREVAKASAAAVKAIGWDALAAAVLARMEREDAPEIARTILAGARAYPADERLVCFLRKVSRVFPAKLAPLVGDLIELKEYRLRDDTFKVEFNARNTQYRIEKAIGLGPITVAYLGWDRMGREAVVVRVLKADFARRPEVTAAFLELARLARLTGNPYTHLVYTFSPPDDEAVYLVRSFAEGRTLREDYAEGNRLTPADVTVLLRNLAEAIRPFHDHDKCHGGVRPANIFITPRRPFYLLGDPSPFRPTDGNPSGTLHGSPDRMTDDARYTAPEAFLDDTPSLAADYYSLGCVAFFALCGRPPFESASRNRLMFDHRDAPAPSPSACGSRAGPLADAIVLRLMAKLPDDRYTSLDDLLDDLKTLRKSVTGGGGAPPPPAPPGTPPGDGCVPDRGPVPGVDGADVSPPENSPADRSIAIVAPVEQAAVPAFFPTTVAQRPSVEPPRPRVPDPSILMSLVSQWELARVRGEPLSVEELCPDDAELRAELSRLLSVRLAVNSESAPATSIGDEFTVAPAQPRRAYEQAMVSIARQSSTAEHGGDDEPRTGTLGEYLTRLPQSIGQYEIRTVLGRGGMGEVYRAVDPRLNREVAIKVLSNLNPNLRARFQVEARALAQIQHPGVCPVYDFGESDGVPFFTMPLLRGGDLSHRIRAGQSLSARVVIRLVADVARTMAYVHSHRIIHRDLKPHNIMLLDSGLPIVMDFGLARGYTENFERPAELLTMEGAIMGTKGYMSPEQASGDQKVIGPPSDVFSLGCILYEMVSGETPFYDHSLQKSIMKLMTTKPTPPLSRIKLEARLQYRGSARRLDALCLQMLSKDPAARPTMEQVAEELLRADAENAPSWKSGSGRFRGWRNLMRKVSTFRYGAILAFAILPTLIILAEWTFGEPRIEIAWLRILLMCLPMMLASTLILPRILRWLTGRN